MGRRGANRTAIERYLTVVRAKLERPTGSSGLNLQEVAATDGKPGSKPPLPDGAIRLLDHEDNRAAATLIGPALRWLGETHGHLHFICRLASSDPARTRRWQHPETEDDATEGEMFEEALTKLESYVEWRAPGVKLYVAYSPDDEPAQSRMQARDQDRRHRAQEAYVFIAAAVREYTESGYSRTAAVHEVATAQDTSPARVWRALAHAQGESA